MTQQVQEAIGAGVLSCFGSCFAKVVTRICPAQEFYAAKQEHQDYLSQNPNAHCSHYLRFKAFPGAAPKAEGASADGDWRGARGVQATKTTKKMKIVGHKFDQHTLSIHLKKEGLLAGVVRAFLARALGQPTDLLEKGTKVGVWYDYYHVGEVVDVDEGQGKVLVKYKREGDS